MCRKICKYKCVYISVFVCLGGGGASEASDTMIPMIVLVGVLLRHCYDLDCERCLLSLDAAAASDHNCCMSSRCVLLVLCTEDERGSSDADTSSPALVSVII